MTDSKLRRIQDALETLFEGILTTNGHRTNLGSHFYWFRGTPLDVSEMPGMTARYKVRTVPSTGGQHEHYMTLFLEIYLAAADAGETCAKAIADVIQKIGTDLTLGGLVEDIQPSGDKDPDEPLVEQEERKFFVIPMNFLVIFVTENWNPDT